jgi:hypothetical protein
VHPTFIVTSAAKNAIATDGDSFVRRGLPALTKKHFKIEGENSSPSISKPERPGSREKGKAKRKPRQDTPWPTRTATQFWKKISVSSQSFLAKKANRFAVRIGHGVSSLRKRALTEPAL